MTSPDRPAKLFDDRCVAASEKFSETVICFTDYSEVTERGGTATQLNAQRQAAFTLEFHAN
jgi:hypothetical protein